jgi:hypothetical protein
MMGRLLVPEQERERLARGDFDDAGHGFDVFGMSAAWLAATERLMAPAYDHYFRVESRGAEHIPAHGAAIVAASKASSTSPGPTCCRSRR